MYLKRSTQVPNEILDQHLPYLNQAQLKVLLVVIRQTLGWIDPKTKKPKGKDWISVSFFHRKTGLTPKSISLAISDLVKRQMIVCLDARGRLLKTPKDRRGKKQIYYTYAPVYWATRSKTYEERLSDMFTFRPNTKPTLTKEYLFSEKSTHVPKRLTDRERYIEIIQSQRDELP